MIVFIDLSVFSEKTIFCPPAADPGLFFLDPFILSMAGAGMPPKNIIQI